jgi:hypothetical protein
MGDGDDLAPEDFGGGHGQLVFLLMGSKAEAALAAKAPVDAAIVASDAGDMTAEVLFEGGRPGHELEAETIVEHGEAAGGERDTLAIGAGDDTRRCRRD